MSLQRILLAAILILLGIMAYSWLDSRYDRKNYPTPRERPRDPVVHKLSPKMAAPAVKPVQAVFKNAKSETSSKKLVLNYVIDDGIAVVMGDVAIGAPIAENTPENGLGEVPTLNLWGSHVIPFYIVPSLPRPERIQQAMALFQGTALQFVEYTDQEDVLVFNETVGVCKSYMGKIGGKQPIWIAPDCGPTEIAHEIMHALGFAHEQSRTDRDDSILVHFENIEEKYKFNFEKLPIEFMQLSGQSPFDFESIMLYPVWMFAERGQPTMESKVTDQHIQPGTQLSKLDIERINRVYGH